MDLSDYNGMEPDMLCSQVNMKLRNEYSDLHDPALSRDIDEQPFPEQMHANGFRYVADVRQLRGSVAAEF
jgi:hypothetical protein